ncbi:virulence factor [Paralcaligenes sp. KSB-10]|jgi:hypothetical protein|uniref:virulence factor n=1 Tax=Paralcaligenes sp. KSB-10 TaxID=2901142 RepID=UPI001E3696FC|nr:virulence factor [Paralcaligenes sp. KSB-10]UHL66143.1 virulence factor [Paralcaligenes sp. KSB-10]
MKRLLLAGIAAVALLGSSAAMARVDVGISIGIPGIVYGEPYYPPVAYVAPPPVVVVPRYAPVPVYGPRYYRDGFIEYRGWRGDRGWHGDRGRGRGHWKHHRGHGDRD